MAGDAVGAPEPDRSRPVGPTFEVPRLEELLPREALTELAASLEATAGLRVWIRARSGADLIGAAPDESAVTCVIESGKAIEHRRDGVSFIVGELEIDHDGLGRLGVGPFVEDEREDLATRPPKMTMARAMAYLDHFRLTLDLILHARQRASYAAAMHLASVEESFAELIRKNTALEEAFDRLKELDQLKSGFLATISHELRTPLTSILGYSEMLAEGMCGPLTKDQLEFVQTIRMKGEQLLRLILSLLDLSKLESGTLRMHPIALPIEAILNDAITTAAPAAAKKGVRLVLEPLPPTPYLRADPDRLRQIFVNLVDNAVKFTPKGGEVALSAREVEAGSEPDERGVVLLAPMRRELEVRVRDDGIGIPPHERNRIFDPFYQVDQSSTREQGGAGLGLAIVKRIVEAHHGRIRVEENSPRGTTFVIRFPLTTSGTSGAKPRVEAPG